MLPRPVPSPRCFAVVVAGVILLASAGSARADLISFSGSRDRAEDPVSFSGTMEVIPPGAGTSTVLKITLDNTTSTGDAVKYGYITGFGFNLPSGMTATNTTTGTPFHFLNAADHRTNLQGGEFDYAFSLSPSQLHTVSSSVINQGIDAGDSPVTFTMELSGSGSATVTAAQIIEELSNGSGSKRVPFSVRFRSTNTNKYKGKDGPDGDKVPLSHWEDITPPPPSNAVPAPPGVVLAGLGVGGLLLGRLRSRK
jgi:hypothetical protein